MISTISASLKIPFCTMRLKSMGSRKDTAMASPYAVSASISEFGIVFQIAPHIGEFSIDVEPLSSGEPSDRQHRHNHIVLEFGDLSLKSNRIAYINAMLVSGILPCDYLKANRLDNSLVGRPHSAMHDALRPLPRATEHSAKGEPRDCSG